MQPSVMKILLDNSLCVLCTCKDDIPDASLMLYECDYQCSKIHMLTLKETTKYLNIANNSKVSLLIDTRDTADDKTTQIQALTIHGEASVVDDNETSRQLIDQMIKKHDKLSNLASNHSVCVIEVSMKSILLLENVDKVSNVSLPDN
jgi:nitroimidazol reductase NimA-like FMN-containing flavoprotein (pyridoxamine 5'-phosphate oxidase superfamily)